MWCCEGTNGKDVVFTRKCVRYALRNYLGWHWGKIKPRKTKGDLDRRDVIAAYLRDFGRALKLEREGHAVLVINSASCTIPDSFSLQMNSDMYLRWVKNRLLPTFEKLYPGKQMILIQDNVSKECALCSAVLLRCAATSDPLSHTRPTLLTGAVPPQARGRWAGSLHEQEVAVRAPGERRVRGEENQAAQARVEEAGRGA